MFALLSSFLIAVAVTAVPQNAVPADARTAIAAANAAWVPALKARDAAAIAAPYADDAVFVTAAGSVGRGRDGVVRLMRERFPQMGTVRDGQIVQDGIIRQGALIYEWGHATLELASGGAPPRQSRARYLTVWQQDGAGRWVIMRNLSLPD